MDKEIFTIFDFETTGPNDPVGTDQIIEIAAIRTDLDKDFGEINLKVQLEKGRTLSDFTKNLTGITEDDLKYGLSEYRAVDILRSFIHETTVVAHHYPFDASFLKAAYPINDPKAFICTRVLVKLVEPGESASLKDVASRIGYSLQGHHQASNNIRATKAILKHYLPLAEAAGIEYRNIVINDEECPLRYVPDFAKVIER